MNKMLIEGGRSMYIRKYGQRVEKEIKRKSIKVNLIQNSFFPFKWNGYDKQAMDVFLRK